MKVLLDTAPLRTGHSHRGIGIYTKCLLQELEKLQDESFTLLSEKDSKSADVIHYPFFDFFQPTLPFHFKTQQKIVITIHDVIPLLFPDEYPRGVRGSLMLLRQIAALQRTKAIITDSFASAKDIHRVFNKSESIIFPTYLAGNPKIKKISVEKAQTVRKHLSLPKKYALYVGDINYNKNLPMLIEAISKTPNWLHLVLAGKNFQPQSISEWLVIAEAIKTHSLEDRIHFVTDFGNDPEFTLSVLYSGADVYVQPSLYEGFGLPVLEALQCLTPVVSFRNSSLSEIGGDVVVYAEPMSAENLALAIHSVLGWKNSDKAQFTVKAAEWLKNFSWKKTALDTLAVYRKVSQS